MDQIKRIMRPTDVPDTGKSGVLAEISLRLNLILYISEKYSANEI